MILFYDETFIVNKKMFVIYYLLAILAIRLAIRLARRLARSLTVALTAGHILARRLAVLARRLAVLALAARQRHRWHTGHLGGKATTTVLACILASGAAARL